jgi:hypothetical protein
VMFKASANLKNPNKTFRDVAKVHRK